MFDEFVACLESLKPGDFVQLKNMQVKSLKNSVASRMDLVMKMPGATCSARAKYGRTINRLDIPNDVNSATSMIITR